MHRRFATLNETVLQSSLRILLTPGVAARATRLGESLRRETGTDVRAADLVERAYEQQRHTAQTGRGYLRVAAW